MYVFNEQFLKSMHNLYIFWEKNWQAEYLWQ